MKKFNIIAYRLKQNTKPCDVLEMFEALLKKTFCKKILKINDNIRRFFNG